MWRCVARRVLLTTGEEVPLLEPSPGMSSSRMMRVDANFQPDVSFVSPVSDGEVRALALQDDGKILAGGNSRFPRRTNPFVS